jgi:lysophospholipase L1-like esterase
VNIRQYLLDYGLADAGITPTEQDLTDIANGMVPQSLRPTGDSYHLNAAGYTVVGKYLYKYVKQLGWID